MSSSGLDNLARIAYEAHRSAHPTPLPAWEDTTEADQQAWRAAVSAVNVQSGNTLIESVPTRSLVIQAGNRQHSFHTEFTAGRLGSLPVGDEFASGHHARFYLAHGLWYIEDLGSTNGTFLNGRRFHGPQRLKKGDKIRIGHSILTVFAA
ncbi:MAG TPA: FHA domain-containing protein [Streptosporangiaceae bacterium]|nr:FHA domain-containing protein [Streptosporangiaceae bacterium]